METHPRDSDEKDSTVSVWGNYLMAFLVTAGVFAVDVFTEKGLLDGALIGIIISKVWDGVTKQNDYFFPTRRSGGSTEKKNGGI